MDEDPPSFNVGLGDFGVGVYATDIAPEDAATPAHVSRVCFDGAREVAALDHVFVLHRASKEHVFNQCAPHQWLATTDDLTLDLDALVVELRWLYGDDWQTIARWDGWEWEEVWIS
jgi:hypothetical protein